VRGKSGCPSREISITAGSGQKEVDGIRAKVSLADQLAQLEHSKCSCAVQNT
jgi:hypothetical protein